MPKYLVVNADEGEPGTCKDLPLMMADPHSLIEGVIISAFAIRSHFAVIYVRGEAVHAHRRLMAAVEEAYAAGYLGNDILGSGFDLELVVHAGAGAYICGEETALLDSLEGYRGQPRLKPPFPAVAGLYGAPTVINNVETLASVPFLVRGGADWFKAFGPEKSPGPKIFSLSGRVVRPGQYEAPMGTTMRELLEMAGGIRPGHELKSWTPGGSSTPLHRRAPRRPAGLRLGRRGRLHARHGGAHGLRRDRLDRRGDPAVHRVLRPRVLRQVHPVPRGHLLDGADPGADRGRRGHRRGPRHPARHLRNILGRSFCALGDGATSPITSSLQYFQDDYVALLPRRSRPGWAAPSASSPSESPHDADTPGRRPLPPGPQSAHAAGRRSLHDRRLRGAVPKGTLIIRAAEQLGVQIPRFCDHPLLDPVGACRQCLVEVEGQRKPVASCTMTVADGMVVQTQLSARWPTRRSRAPWSCC